jgi:hypothetical protein
VGGDPLELPVDVLDSMLSAIADIENWKHGESPKHRQDRVYFERLEQLL